MGPSLGSVVVHVGLLLPYREKDTRLPRKVMDPDLRFPHLIKGNRDNIVRTKDRNSSLGVFQGVLDAVVDFLSGPHEAVLEILEEIYLPDPFRSTFFPPAPVPVVVEIVLSGARLKDLVPGFGPGEFVADFSHKKGVAWSNRFSTLLSLGSPLVQFGRPSYFIKFPTKIRTISFSVSDAVSLRIVLSVPLISFCFSG